MGNFNRDDRRGGGRRFGQRDQGGGRFDRPREMHKVTCSECGKETEVPFRPTGDRPVYCRECFAKMGGGESRRSFGDRNDSRPSQSSGSNAQLSEINAKLDQLIKLLTHSQSFHSDESSERAGQAPKKVKSKEVPTVVKKKKVLKKIPKTPIEPPTETPEE